MQDLTFKITTATTCLVSFMASHHQTALLQPISFLYSTQLLQNLSLSLSLSELSARRVNLLLTGEENQNVTGRLCEMDPGPSAMPSAEAVRTFPLRYLFRSSKLSQV